MTNELEKKFFHTFDIKPSKQILWTMNCACGCHDCENCDKYTNNFSKIYPQITDTILLKLICLWNDNCLYTEDMIAPTNYDTTKDYIFNHFIDIKRYIFRIKRKIIKQQVQTLFKETK